MSAAGAVLSATPSVVPAGRPDQHRRQRPAGPGLPGRDRRDRRADQLAEDAPVPRADPRLGGAGRGRLDRPDRRADQLHQRVRQHRRRGRHPHRPRRDARQDPGRLRWGRQHRQPDHRPALRQHAPVGHGPHRRHHRAAAVLRGGRGDPRPGRHPRRPSRQLDADADRDPGPRRPLGAPRAGSAASRPADGDRTAQGGPEPDPDLRSHRRDPDADHLRAAARTADGPVGAGVRPRVSG